MLNAMMDTGTLFAERRSATRHRACKGAHIRFNKGYGAYEAVVRDLSAEGARLRFGDIVDLPQQFDIRIGPDGPFRPARITWRHSLDVGIALV